MRSCFYLKLYRGFIILNTKCVVVFVYYSAIYALLLKPSLLFFDIFLMSGSILNDGRVQIFETEEQDYVVWYFVRGKIRIASAWSFFSVKSLLNFFFFSHLCKKFLKNVFLLFQIPTEMPIVVRKKRRLLSIPSPTRWVNFLKILRLS